MIEIIVNPAAGNGRAKVIAEEVTRYLTEKNIEHTMVYTEHPDHATELAKDAAARGIETVVALGGDGTVTEVARGLAHTGTALGIIPSGTGNDFIKAINIPRSWRDAVDFILTHPAREVNTGTMNDRFFMNACGAGFDVMVLDYSIEAKKHCSGIWPYFYGIIRAIKNYKPFRMHVEVGDDLVLDGEYMLCSIANGQYIGGGIPIARQADVTDGLLDVLVVDAVPRWKIPFYLPAIMLGTLPKLKPAHLYRVQRCRLSSPGMRLNLDGEVLPIEDASFALKADALKIHW
ncbi:MAG: diacylglycerol kinase family lipid kinase [Clostridiales bacterium]|nr:diacylglycerol kinase family lipid kinase [Clostridiales bacterium]